MAGVWVGDQLSKNAFGRELTTRGVASGKKKIGTRQRRVRTGIRLLDADERVTDDG